MTTEDRLTATSDVSSGDLLTWHAPHRWTRRVYHILRHDFSALIILGLTPALLGVFEQIAVDIVRPSTADIRYQLGKAIMRSPTLEATPETLYEIAYRPVMPTVAFFTVGIATTLALCLGAAYYRTVRLLSGQPEPLLESLRAAMRRVLPSLGWGALTIVGAMILFLLFQLPGWTTGDPRLNVIGPVLGALALLIVFVVSVSTFLGVVYLERAGIGRCFWLVTGRFWVTTGRALLITVGWAVYLVALVLLMTLLMMPFGGLEALRLLGRWIAYAVSGLLGVPLFGYTVAATLVTYAELRFREDPTTTTATLARGVPM